MLAVVVVLLKVVGAVEAMVSAMSLSSIGSPVKHVKWGNRLSASEFFFFLHMLDSVKR